MYEGPKPAGMAMLQKGKAESKDMYKSWALLSSVLLMVLSTFEGKRMGGILLMPGSSTQPIFFPGAAR